MKLILDVKNNKKIINPSRDDILLYDGKEWFVTTKEDLFKEYDEKFASKLTECEQKIAELTEFKVSMAKQILALSKLIEGIIAKENK